MRVSVIGQGYVGLTISIAAANSGHNVTGVDLSNRVVEGLLGGKSHIEGVSDSEIARANSEGRYLATTDYKKISDAEVIVIAVPTPLDSSGNPDLALLEKAAKSIGENLESKALIINESTSHPGTLRELIRPMVELGAPFENLYAISPERVDPGNKNFGAKNTPRVVGGLTDEARDRAVDFYRTFCDVVIPTSSAEVAEAAKLLENTFRFINIGLINEFSQLMTELGIPVNEVISAAATKPYGFMPFHPNVGIGGHCIPVDPFYLQKRALEAGIESRYISLSESINKEMPRYVIDRLIDAFGNLKGKKIQVFGVAYKANVSDTRETPATSVIDILRQEGAEVSWHDPLVAEWNGEVSSEVDLKADLGLVLVYHDKMKIEEFSAPIFSVNPNRNYPDWKPLLGLQS